MKNIDVVKAFITGREAKTQHLKTDGTKLINYSTVIAKKENGEILLSSTKYSPTTSTIQNMVRRATTVREVEMGW